MRTLIGGTMLGSDPFAFLIGEEDEDPVSNCERRGPEPRLGDTVALVGDRCVGGGEVVLSKASTVLALLVT